MVVVSACLAAEERFRAVTLSPLSRRQVDGLA